MHTGRGTIQKFPQLPDFQAVWTQHRNSDNTSPFVAHAARYSSRLEETERVWRLRNMMANAHKHCDEAKPIPPTQFTLPERIPRQQAVVANTSSWRFWGSSFNDFLNSGAVAVAVAVSACQTFWSLLLLLPMLLGMSCKASQDPSLFLSSGVS